MSCNLVILFSSGYQKLLRDVLQTFERATLHHEKSQFGLKQIHANRSYTIRVSKELCKWLYPKQMKVLCNRALTGSFGKNGAPAASAKSSQAPAPPPPALLPKGTPRCGLTHMERTEHSEAQAYVWWNCRQEKDHSAMHRMLSPVQSMGSSSILYHFDQFGRHLWLWPKNWIQHSGTWSGWAWLFAVFRCRSAEISAHIRPVTTFCGRQGGLWPVTIGQISVRQRALWPVTAELVEMIQ